MTSPFRVPVAVLLRDMPSTMPVVFSAPFDAEHEFPPRGPAESDVDPEAPVSVNVTLQSHPGGITVRGQIEVAWHGICRRCSVPVTGDLHLKVHERYRDQEGLVDEETYPIEQDFIDLSPLVHDAVFLELPLAPLCRPDCKGLCAQCGADLNEGECDCPPPLDPRWATLDALRFEDSDES